jgi:alkanesulfonate monooxygenase SsuD/methylene tetrahydromethanopterin reductase-like flavin-dependent oxidoreductase (luciferase family)
MFVLRFDVRSPEFGAPPADLYAAALDMAEFAEANGFAAVVVSEHHATDDGYLPSPLVMASALAARTSTIPISVAALLVPLYDPVRLAEDIAVLDNVSRGRVSYIVGIGYRPVEYEMFGLDYTARARTVESHVILMQQLWSGEPVEHDGRVIQVRPTPYSRPHPMLFYGGGSGAAARRAARLDLPFFPQSSDTRLVETYQAERARLGLPEGVVVAPGAGPLNVFVSEDPDATWARIGEHLLHDARSYARWQVDAGIVSVALDEAESVAALRAGSVYAVLTPDECVEVLHRHGSVAMHPLCGGIPPEIAWESLELVKNRVQPAISTSTAPSAPALHPPRV